jgi:hypothetical protein
MTTETLILHRAVAHRLERRDTPLAEQQPEVHVFVEATSTSTAAAVLLRGLSLAWGCDPADVEFYNLHSEQDLMGPANCSGHDLGDAALLVSGWYHGPLFIRPDRTLMLVRPRTLARLHEARALAAPLARKQRLASLSAAGLDRSEAHMRAGLVAELVRPVGAA